MTEPIEQTTGEMELTETQRWMIVRGGIPFEFVVSEVGMILADLMYLKGCTDDSTLAEIDMMLCEGETLGDAIKMLQRLPDGGGIMPNKQSIQNVLLTEIIIEFIDRIQLLAYDFGVCVLCGCRREQSEIKKEMWAPRHYPTCLYARARAAIQVR